LVQLFQRDYPPELMGAKFVNRTTRIAWHLTSISWAAAGVILVVLALNPVMPMGGFFARIIAVCFLLSALLSAIGSHGLPLVLDNFLIQRHSNQGIRQFKLVPYL